MEPIQRIPRYTLLWRMIKHMLPSDPQRTKLIEADAIANQIALCETDEQTRRAAVMYCLHSTIDGFPPKLISNRRHLLDSIDVEDHDNDEIAHASLFLFDDILIIAKRQNTGMSGKVLAGLDNLERSGGTLPNLLASRREECLSKDS
jgi:protein ECT2